MVGLTMTSSKRTYSIPKSAGPLPLRQSTADLYLHRRHSNTVLSQFSGGVSGSWCAQGLFEPSECLWQVCGLILNVRSMSHSKLEVVRKETARVNINIIEMSELKWTRISKFNSDDPYIY